MSRASRRSLYCFGAVLAVVIGIFGAQVLRVRATFARTLPETQAPAPAMILGVAGHRIAGRVFTTGTASAQLPLVIVLHGDAPTRNPGYQYSFAAKLADAVPGVRVIALLRPGYMDPFGLKSDGDRGFSAGENYTMNVVQNLSAAIGLLKARFQATSVILVGHSGGAAIAADIAALVAEPLQQVFLISCPCDVPPFRQHMATLMHDPLFWLPSKTLSPLITLAQMHVGTSITAMTGENDPIALPEYAREYVTAARSRGMPATLTLLQNLGHEILEQPTVIGAVAEAIRLNPAKTP